MVDKPTQCPAVHDDPVSVEALTGTIFFFSKTLFSALLSVSLDAKGRSFDNTLLNLLVLHLAQTKLTLTLSE